MLNQIAEKLSAHAGLSAWQVRRTISRGTQLYLIGHETESRREVQTERYAVTVFVEREEGGRRVMGESEFLHAPGDGLDAAIDKAAAMARLVANEPFALPEAGGKYEVPETVDREVVERPGHVVERIREDIFSAVNGRKGICLSAAEIYADYRTINVLNSSGLGVEREETELYAEFVLFAGTGGGCQEVEAGTARRARFYEHLKIAGVVDEYAGYAIDSLTAVLPPTGTFDVVFSGEALDTLFNWFVSQAGGAARYQRWSVFEEGKPVIDAPEGDRLTLWSNPSLPGGMRTRAFDDQGLPMRRVEVVRDGVFNARPVSKRYADYLGLPATGDFANVVVSSGSLTKGEIFGNGPVLHLCRFSTFEPNGVTGAFSGEIRSGWVVDGGRVIPIKGGAVTGVMQEAFRRALFSHETVQREAYHGPAYVKLCKVDIGGE